MGKMKVLQSSLNGGELTPKLKGRPELPRYQSGLETCRNFVPLVVGGAKVRPGTRMVGTPLTSASDEIRLESYNSPDDSGVYRGFCLERTAFQVRAFKGTEVGGSVLFPNPHPQEPFQTLPLDPFQVGQNQEDLYLVHPEVQPLALKRNTDDDWSIDMVEFVSIPFVRPPKTDGITLTPDATTGNCNVTASADFFQPGHVGVRFQLNGGIIKITEVVDATTAKADIVTNFTTVGASAKAKTFIVNYEPEDVGGQIPTFAPTPPYTFNIICRADFASNELRTTVPTPFELALHRFSVQVVDNEAALTGTEPDEYWKEEAWSDLRGWPRTVGFYEQRLLLAGTATYPTTIWGSKIGNMLDFTLGTDDDDAISYTLATADTPIRSILADDRIYVFTANKIITIDTGNEKSLSPTNFRIRSRGKQGAATIPPFLVGNEILFASVSRAKIFNLAYSLATDRFDINDVTIYGEHLIEEGISIEQIAVTREPVPMLWCRTAAGGIITLTYDASQQVAAWAKQDVGGIVRQVVKVLDENGKDQVYAVVQREEGTFIELFDWNVNTDCCITGSDPEGKTEWIASHLDGRQVVAVADGYVVQNLTVTDGKVTLPFSAKEVEIGLPFTARLKDLPPAVAGVSSTISGQVSVNQIQVLLHDTKGATVNGERLPFQKFGGELLDKPVPSFTGWKKLGALGWGDSGSGGQVEIVRDQPLPCTVLAIAKSVTVND